MAMAAKEQGPYLNPEQIDDFELQPYRIVLGYTQKEGVLLPVFSGEKMPEKEEQKPELKKLYGLPVAARLSLEHYFS